MWDLILWALWVAGGLYEWMKGFGWSLSLVLVCHVLLIIDI